MQRKKVDNRIRILIENGVAEKQRMLFVIVGDHGKDQVEYYAMAVNSSLFKNNISFT